MFEHTSRYYTLETETFTDEKGRAVSYKKRRFLPQSSAGTLLAEVTVTQGDRLDIITARTLGDPEQFWRLCDANLAMHPRELTAEIGRRLHIPLIQAGG